MSFLAHFKGRPFIRLNENAVQLFTFHNCMDCKALVTLDHIIVNEQKDDVLMAAGLHLCPEPQASAGQGCRFMNDIRCQKCHALWLDPTKAAQEAQLEGV